MNLSAGKLDIVDGSYLGLNYSGFHDSAIAIVAPDGEPLYAASLERFSRVKQDGRPPYIMLDQIPMDKISKIAISTYEQFVAPQVFDSKTHPQRLPKPREEPLVHDQLFYDVINSIPGEKVFVGHHTCHASLAFFGSGFDEALCFTYDGGMHNDPWFGCLYQCSRTNGIIPVDRFSSMHYSKITSLYSFVTAILGFTPNKHEGKITGLAAYGKISGPCLTLLERWFEQDYFELEKSLYWIFSYSKTNSPQLIPHKYHLDRFREETAGISREDMAATLQYFAERHVLEILEKAKHQGWESQNICLAGGLFANVKINQRVVEFGYSRLFVAPPMTDDGTALGAAWALASESPHFSPKPLRTVFLGPSYAVDAAQAIVQQEDINVTPLEDAPLAIAKLLANGSVVAVFQGASEFGPRALGNRSILAPAVDHEINQRLNRQLNRTEFMPFAPMTRIEDAEDCYQNIDRVRHTAEFMTVTVNCTELMKQTCPAVVHVDGTARPQLVSSENNIFIHQVLTCYLELTGINAIVNTSFNIHEEPIVCSSGDALRGFFESGVDYLFMEGIGLISYADNKDVAIRYLREKLENSSSQNKYTSAYAIIDQLDQENNNLFAQNEKKEYVIRRLNNITKEREKELTKIIERVSQAEATNALLQLELEQKNKVISDAAPFLTELCIINQKLNSSLKRQTTFTKFLFFLPSFVGRLFLPRLGRLYQHRPRKLHLPNTYRNTLPLDSMPLVSIVTPSFNHARYLARTIESVLGQDYPNIEYRVQDGCSTDNSLEIIKRYADKLEGWESTPDNGQTNAINRAFARTHGEIMAWLNSDDILLPGALPFVVDFFNKHPGVDVVYGNRILLDELDMQIGSWVLPPHDNEVLSWADFIPQETLFWRRSIWEKVGGRLDEYFHYAMDWDLILRFRNAGAKFVRLPRFLGGFRVHHAQKTTAMSNIGEMEMNKLRERELGYLPDVHDIRHALRPYLLKHLAADWGLRLGVNHKYLK